ncbi:hypothetical protein [Bowmanella dokdonensis]|uniref:Uncharacterized protein n=1 Tax=Bowmanella dokdonensis TaxID=751969 RepID=A0A939DT96_9ALTE|nr:hypothetical protein [Bowmanella dokdonensis]MBN7827501.1 hypothetical protein [Bowmanella dokdonensis]
MQPTLYPLPLTYRHIAAYLLTVLLCLLSVETQAGQVDADNPKLLSGLAFDSAAEGLPLQTDNDDQDTVCHASQSLPTGIALASFPCIQAEYLAGRSLTQARAPPAFL